MKRTLTAALILSALTAGAACSDTTTEPERRSVEVREAPAAVTMDDVWWALTPTERTDACQIWNTERDIARDLVGASAEDMGLDPQVYFDLLDGKC